MIAFGVISAITGMGFALSGHELVGIAIFFLGATITALEILS